MQLLHIAAEAANRSIWNDVFVTALSGLGDLTILENGAAMTDGERARHIRNSDILLTGWGTAAVPMEIARNRGRLQYICHITGGMRGAIPLGSSTPASRSRTGARPPRTAWPKARWRSF